ncbi:amino acid ABC transporter permease [Thalassospira lucentensis]|nr:amino acid ABC transporter permease [Thalassospira lucentensis]
MTTPLPENASRPRTKTGPGWPLGLFSGICGVILMATQPGIWIGMDNMIGDVIVALAIGGLIWLNFRLLHNLPFRVQTTIIWAELLLGFALFFYSFDLSFDFIGSRLPFLLGLRLEGEFLQGAVLTLFISLVSIFCATVLALAAALGRLSKNGVFYGISTFYTSFFRGTPLLLQVMLIYLGLPQVGIVLSAVPAGIIALSLCYGAYMAEIFRAGIEGVPEGQTEAALSLGLKPYQVMRLVILPQALRLVIPPTGNQFISMLKDSSLVSVMGVWELMYLARTHGRSEFKYMEMLISAALIYWALSGIFEFIQSRIEKKLGKGVRV